jgi:hypothetical protein
MLHSPVLIYALALVAITSCNSRKPENVNRNMIEQAELTNEGIRDYPFLECKYQDPYFPKFLVDKCRQIFMELCQNIETQKPGNLQELYTLPHAATPKLNDLQEEFFENNSEIESGASECLAMNFVFIAQAYGFDADIEELIATREW